MIAALTGAAERLLGAVPLAPGDVRRQDATVRETAHRPWPMPNEPWMLAQTWHDLLFAHWAVSKTELQEVVPAKLTLDLFDGRAWVGVTPFVVSGFRMRGTPPIPFLSSFNELNVRTYVRVGDRPGIYFLSLDADSRIAVMGARRSHRLPYFRARMQADRGSGEVRYRHERVSADGPAARFEATYRLGRGPFTAAPGSLEHWLAERYCLYTLDERGRVLRGDIHHPPWPLHEASADVSTNTMSDGLGIALRGAPLLHGCPRQDTLLWGVRPA